MASSSHERAEQPVLDLERGSTLQRAATQLERVAMNLDLMRSNTLPTEDKALRHAATMPITFDVGSVRPFCCGLWKLQQLFGMLLGVGCFLTISWASPFDLQDEANRMLGITMMCGSFWVFEVLPICITAVLPVLLMPMCGITSSALAADAYWDPIQLLVIGTYLVDIAMEEVKLPRRVALNLLLFVGVVRPWLLLLVVMLLTFLLSMFTNNIAVTLMICPFAVGLMNAAEEHALNEVADVIDAIDPPLAEEEHEARVKEATLNVQRFSIGLLLGIAYASTAGGLATLVGCIPNELLMNSQLSSQVSYSGWLVFAFPVALTTFVLAYAVVYFRYVHGLQIMGMTREVLESEHEELIAEIGHFSRDELVVAMVQLVQFVFLFCRPWISRLPMFETKYGESLMGDSTLAVLPAIFLFFAPSALRPGQSVLTWSAVHDKFDFGLVLLIGGGLAIASGFLQSGLDVALGDWVTDLIGQGATWPLMAGTVTVCAIATQLFSAVGTASTVIPVLMSASRRALHNPLRLALPATVACSFAFMLPTATPANIVVLAKSRDLSVPLRVRDFFLTGLPVNVLMVILGTSMMLFTAQQVFDVNAPLPHWACELPSCVWTHVEGIVHGAHVTHQACAMDVVNGAEMCRLANGTFVNSTLVIFPF